jgi:hypothetical protein
MYHLERFKAIDSLLNNTRQYWQCVAFSEKAIPWPELTESLMSLSEGDVEQLDSDQGALNTFLSHMISCLVDAEKLINLIAKQSKSHKFPFWLTNGIKGNKVAQLESFVTQTSNTQLPLLEWCAGKGHLGRLYSFANKVPVQSVEIQAPLVAQGQVLAERFQLDIQLDELDVLTDKAVDYLKQDQHAVALHACGGLHQALIKHGVTKQTKQLSISPCCYHLFQPSDCYEAMSEAAKSSSLRLTSSDLKLALQETVTSGKRITRLREIETHWRLAFDCLLDDVTDKQGYLSVPSAKKALFSGEFKDFCLWAADKKGIQLPVEIDYDHYLTLGKKRRQITQRIELVRHGFRRLIELWLVLDRVLYLEQYGYDVSISEFCQKNITPRNILIEATKL